MSAFAPQLVRALATGAAVETGRAVARRNGMGFLQFDDEEYADDYFYPYESGGGYDFGGSGWDYWFGGSGGDSYDVWPSFDPIALPDLGPAPTTGWWQDFYDLFNPDPDVPTISINTVEPGQWPDYRTITGDLDYRPSIWDWLNDLGPGPASMDPQYGPAGDGSTLPGYCPKGTYHPVNDPYACVPFPADNTAAKKQAAQQKKAQQSAANAMKAAQKKQDQSCPKHPQGLPVWKNPQTGKCEVVPQCPQGAKFDSATRRCLSAAQAKELYGDNSWLWWLIGGGAVFLLATRDSGGRRR